MPDEPNPIQNAEVLPAVTSTDGAPQQSKMERAVAAIMHGIALLDEKEGKDPITDTSMRESLQHLKATFTPSVYQNGKHYKFTFKQQRLMFHLGEIGDFRQSCALAGIDEDDAARFLSSAKFQEFFRERVEESAVRRGWSADHFVAQLDDVWMGRKAVTREQMDAIKEIGARVAPKIERIQHEFDASEFVFEPKE
jgi:hypothetical protein